MVKDERKPPKWLTTEYLQNALRESLQEPDLQITSCEITPATKIGDNYSSIIFRLILTTTSPDKSLSLVCKTPALLENLDIVMESMNKTPFQKEADIIEIIMGRINAVLTKMPQQEPICAKFVYHAPECLILEDLKVEGFELADRIEGLDWETTKLVLAGLAKLHAASLEVLQDDPKIFKDCSVNPWADPTNSYFKEFVDSSLAVTIQEAAEWPEFPKEYLERLRKHEGTMLDSMRKSIAVDDDGLNVFGHGDCWITNVMFSKDAEGRYERIRFVDFQSPSICSPALDLNYFLFTSPKLEIRFQIIDQALQFYHQTFLDTIKALNISLPKEFTLDALKADFRRLHFFGFGVFISIYPITVNGAQDNIVVNDFFSVNDNKRRMHRNERFRKGLKMAMAYFVENGSL